jgi:prepilin-type N-terminal cleavage/methylation domain-containing protein/prepilin-type processing-associated H-X9-DG protein
MTPSARRDRNRTNAFTLVELLVVIAIIGILVALLLPAVQAAREAARRSACVNNQKNLALACLNFESTHKALPYARKVDQWDSYTWLQEILPYIEQQAVYDNFRDISSAGPMAGVDKGGWSPAGDDAQKRSARHTQIPPYYCPSDTTPVQNEMGSPTWGLWRGNYRASVGSENNLYGDTDATLSLFRRDATVNKTVFGPGCFEVKSRLLTSTGQITDSTNKYWKPKRMRLGEISDGTSSTIMLAEGISATEVVDWGGVMGSVIYGNMGGALFATLYGPNEAAVPDQVLGPCPRQQGDSQYPDTAPCTGGGHPGEGQPGGGATHVAARSHHPGGVNVAMADGSVDFKTDGVDVAYWRSLGTRGNGDVVNAN